MNPHVTGLQNPIVEDQSSAPPGWLKGHQSQPAWPVGGAEKGTITSLLASIQGGTDWLQKKSSASLFCYILQIGLSKG